MALQKTCEALEKDGRNASIEIKQLRSRLQNAEDQLENTKSLARKEVQGHQNDIKSIKACNGRLRSDLETAENKIVGLQAEIHTADEKFQTSEISAAEEISRLTTDVDMVNEELFKEKNSARKEIAQLQSQIKLLNEKNDKFRQILIPVSEKQVLDAEVVQRFTSLRTSMLALVRRTWKPAFRDDADVISLSQDQIHVFKFGGMCDYDRLRYAVFHFIHDRIIGNRNYFLENGFEETEKRLQLVEQELFEKSPVGEQKTLSQKNNGFQCIPTHMSTEDRKQVIEWRSASFKATECFRGSGRVLSRETQSQIWDFFGPIQTANPEAEEIGRKKLEEICDAAVDFSLVTRQLKDNFWVDGMRRAVGQPVSEWDHLVEEMASVTAGKGKQPGTIAYVIVGALIKYPRENLEKALVLEKAEVGVYR